MATVSTQSVTLTGTPIAFSPASGGGDKFTPDDATVLLIKNGGGASITATIVTPWTGPAGLALADATVPVAAGAEVLVGAFAGPYWAGASGLADITWSSTTSVTWAAVRS